MRLEQALRAGRHVGVREPDEADLLLVNTCGFIDDAIEQSIETVRALDEARRADQQLYVVGCLTQIAAERVTAAVPSVDATFGAEQWDAVASALGPAEEHYDIPQPDPMNLGGPSAYLKISDGCDRPCTFCIIPTIKGGMQSAPVRQLVAEARLHAAAGAKELVLVAQDSTAYGEDAGDPEGLATLLEALAEAVPEVPWIRLMYAYPGRVTERLAATMAALPNVVPYLDMPLQHGSDAVLRRMRRPPLRVTRRSIELVRSAMPEGVMRTTFIVGYPGETEAEFEELLDFVAEERFERLGAFTYSPQPGTPAAAEPGQVADEVKAERFAALMELAQGISLEHQREQIGREFEVLVESLEPTETMDGEPISVGRTWRDAPEVDGLALLKGSHAAGALVRARVDGALPYDLLCTPVEVTAPAG